jgi:hypothetical protein
MRLLLFCAVAVSACEPCNGSVLLTVKFPDFAVAADQIQVGTSVLGPDGPMQPVLQTVQHRPGESSSSVNLKVARYQAGELVSIEVLATQQGALLAGSRRSLRLSPSCTSFTMDLAVTEISVRVEQAVKNKADILFMIDDSNSTSPKQNELKTRFPELIKVLDDAGAMGNPGWYHIGVVTSDLGAGSANNGCAVGGLGARLQPVGRGHGPTCVPPTGGLNFIDYNQLNGTNNLPAGVSLPDEFTCMASVGAGGCGFEHPLEAVYKALHDCMPDPDGSYSTCTIPQNVDFLRPDSILAVLFLTDEDDCSAPVDTDLFDQAATQYGPRTSFRCSNYGIECGMSLLPYGDSGGPLADCHGAPNPDGMGPGKLFDVNRYIDFFGRSSAMSGGGVRVDPNDVILAAIDAPSEPVQTFVGNADTNAPCPAGAMVGQTGCQVFLGHSCNSTGSFFGDPAVRINQVVSSVSSYQIASVCVQDYTSTLAGLGELIVSKLGISCLAAPLTDVSNPSCVVEDLANANNSIVATIPSCAAAGGISPCWRYQENQRCPPLVDPRDPTRVTQGSIAIQRDAVPPGTHASVTCLAATVPGASP